ncbi:enoyl-CoA hydratase/isomerase family protein [Myxococcota bacterium]|nr:enoyl-CoA hydratase/isomerase family protein [Myxococcota bacterium]
MRHFDEYSQAYPHVRMRREDGILELALHSEGGSLLWGSGPHTELGHCFADIGADPDNRIVILTGTGDEFIARLDRSWVREMTPELWREIYAHGRRLLMNLLEIEVPMVAAVNGPATVHAELALLCDIVLASETATFKDAPHFRYGTVPGDGVHLLWPLLLGMNRGRHFLLTGKKFDAHEAERLGLVAEVLPPKELLDRAWDIARDLAQRPAITLRYTRLAMTQILKQVFQQNLSYGLALEGLGAWNEWPSE